DADVPGGTPGGDAVRTIARRWRRFSRSDSCLRRYVAPRVRFSDVVHTAAVRLNTKTTEPAPSAVKAVQVVAVHECDELVRVGGVGAVAGLGQPLRELAWIVGDLHRRGVARTEE